ncbi:MAG: hypothetical protein ACE5KU_04520 [Nitrososphaerales archaeon]
MLTHTYTTQRSLFILSGEDSTIPLGELDALVKTYSSNAKIKIEGHRVALVEGDLDPAVVSKRAAYMRLGGIHIGSVDNPSEEEFRRLDFTKLPDFRSFAARTYNFTDTDIKPDVEAALGHAVKQSFPSAKVSLKKPDMLVVGVSCEDAFHICGVDTASTRRSWYHRRPRIRPFFHPSALYPKFARLLVNLAQIKEGELLLDPFCGTGSILIEAGVIGIRSWGIDISRRMCTGALRNLKHFDISSSGIVSGDASHLQLVRVDGVSTDLPYGRASSTHKRKIGVIAEDLMDNLEALLPKGRYACIVHPHYASIPEGRRFEQVQEHKIYIHRRLTRTITLLKRV